jgi:hypothetical protein
MSPPKYVASEMRRYALVSQTRVLDWRGNHYRFERMEPTVPPAEPDLEWSVSRQGEFIGTMRSPPGESTLDFELGAFHWLRTLFGSALGTYLPIVR